MIIKIIANSRFDLGEERIPNKNDQPVHIDSAARRSHCGTTGASLAIPTDLHEHVTSRENHLPYIVVHKFSRDREERSKNRGTDQVRRIHDTALTRATASTGSQRRLPIVAQVNTTLLPLSRRRAIRPMQLDVYTRTRLTLPVLFILYSLISTFFQSICSIKYARPSRMSTTKFPCSNNSSLMKTCSGRRRRILAAYDWNEVVRVGKTTDFKCKRISYVNKKP